MFVIRELKPRTQEYRICGFKPQPYLISLRDAKEQKYFQQHALPGTSNRPLATIRKPLTITRLRLEVNLLPYET